MALTLASSDTFATVVVNYSLSVACTFTLLCVSHMGSSALSDKEHMKFSEEPCTTVFIFWLTSKTG